MQGMELRKLKRTQLVEMVQNLQTEQEATRQALALAEEKLQDREVAIANAGSMAEATCRINGVMEAADAAAEQYIENARRQSEEARAKGEQMLKETEERCADLEEETRIRCEDMIVRAKDEAQAYWDEVYARLQQYCKASDALKEYARPNDTEMVI